MATDIRHSHMEYGKIYFWTATINSWKWLLKEDNGKDIIIDSLSFLSKKELVDVFAFVIMPNHVHFIWRMNKPNGKERPSGSFLKFTAHQFKKTLQNASVESYRVDRINKEFEFWQRDPLATELYTPDVAYQKLDYIHQNPLAKDWNLAASPEAYLYSSASFYEEKSQKFPFLKHLGDEL